MRLFALVLVGVLVGTLSHVGAIAAERIGQVKVASGDVTITRGDEMLPAEAGTELFEQDVIETGANSAVGMTFTDNSRMSLGPDSSLTLERYSYQKRGQQDGFDARLRSGSLTAASGNIAKSRPLAMKVLMPSTVLGVKGTEFAVRVGGEN